MVSRASAVAGAAPVSAASAPPTSRAVSRRRGRMAGRGLGTEAVPGLADGGGRGGTAPRVHPRGACNSIDQVLRGRDPGRAALGWLGLVLALLALLALVPAAALAEPAL